MELGKQINNSLLFECVYKIRKPLGNELRTLTSKDVLNIALIALTRSVRRQIPSTLTSIIRDKNENW